MHSSDLLWRVFHQTHHSAERVDIWGALYFHPLDVIGFAFVGSLDCFDSVFFADGLDSVAFPERFDPCLPVAFVAIRHDALRLGSFL